MLKFFFQGVKWGVEGLNQVFKEESSLGGKFRGSFTIFDLVELIFQA